MIKFTVKDVEVSVDESKLSKETLAKVLKKGLSRIAFERETGKDKTEEQLKAALLKIEQDPEQYYSLVRVSSGEGRAKDDMYTKKAKSWFMAEFMPLLKVNHKNAIAIWVKAGGNGSLLKVTEKMTPEVTAVVEKNVAARDAIIAAKAKKLKDSGWEPELI